MPSLPWRLDAGNSIRKILGIFQDGTPLVTHSQIFSTFPDGGSCQISHPGETPGIVVDVKIPTHVLFTKSDFPGLPDYPHPHPHSWGKPLIGAFNLEGREGGYQIPVPSLNLAQIPVPRLIFAKVPVTKSKIPLLMIICKIMRIIN